MKKRLALIVISLDECFSKAGFSGGGHKVTKHLISGIIGSGAFDIDIYCKASAVKEIEGVNSIKVLNKKTFEAELIQELGIGEYDYVLSSDVLLPFGNLIIHSNSAKFKTHNGKGPIVESFAKFYAAKKIASQQKCFNKNDKHFFVVSERLKSDYVQSYGIDEDRVFVSYPATDEVIGDFQFLSKSKFVLGAMAGGGLNKGGYLFLLALFKFITQNQISHERFGVRIIFPKIRKSGFYKLLIRLLGLEKFVELLPRQSDMKSFYESVDCYVLPSLNEAFGLVVTEAASYGKPSIVSSTTGVCELVKDFENGFVFNRSNSPVKNLSEKLKTVFNLYFNDFGHFVKIADSAAKIPSDLSWKKFCDVILANMREEKK